MKRFLLQTLSLFLFSTLLIVAQPRMTKLFSKSYSAMNISPRITNSGIYALKSFAVLNNKLLLATERGNLFFNLKGERISDADKNIFKATEKNEIVKTDTAFLAVPNFFKQTKFFTYDNGLYKSNGNNKIQFTRVSSSLLRISVNLNDESKIFSFPFQDNLAYAGLIGIDKYGDFFITVEKFLSQVPLKIEREIWVLNNKGKILSKLILPTIKYLTFNNELTINPQGELFHLITEPGKITLIKWDGLTKFTKWTVQYPNYLRKFIHYDSFTTTKEIVTKPNEANRLSVSTTRAEVVRRGEEYAEHKYYCTSKNLAPTGTTAPDGDRVKTPSWLRVGWNARIPYKWGGFNTVWGFDHDLAQGEFAGDIATDGVSGYAVGVDCSGFVSRCWGLTYHASTAYMPNITDKYNSWDELKPGDAVHKVGHVRLFVRHNSDGSLRIVEAAGRNWDVSYWSYKPSDLTAYTPRYYVGMTGRYLEKSVKLREVLKVDNGVKLQWSCDTSGVFGYRIYGSTNGKDWSLIFTEDTVKADSFIVKDTPSEAYFRISAVGDSYGTLTESNWSNPAGFSSNGEEKYLIVDGFNRDYGYASWQGDGNPFAVTYGLGIAKTNSAFESVKNSEVESGKIKLDNYDGVFWYDGDESTVDKTFSSTEQSILKKYLENGGKLFVSGSEIGWDLYHKGDEADKDFYTNYFKAIYVADDANTTRASGEAGSNFEGLDFNFGQTYVEDYPDVISATGGSKICLKYSNGKGAGISYTGTFGTSSKIGKVIYFAFGPESTADDSVFFKIIEGAVNYFRTESKAEPTTLQPNDFSLLNPYPNPFGANSSTASISTNINFTVVKTTEVKIAVYNLLGQQVAVLTNGKILPGKYSVKFLGNNLSSGVYFVKANFNNFIVVRKLMLLK